MRMAKLNKFYIKKMLNKNVIIRKTKTNGQQLKHSGHK